MNCTRRFKPYAGTRVQRGAILVVVSVFIFLLTYIALAAVDIASVDARLASSLRAQTDARVLLDGAVRALLAQESERLLASGDAMSDLAEASPCQLGEGCGDEPGWSTLRDDGRYRVSYRTRHVAAVSRETNAYRQLQSQVSSHVQYESLAYEIDVQVVRQPDEALLAAASLGLHAARPRAAGPS